MMRANTCGPLALLLVTAVCAGCDDSGDAVEPSCGEGTVAQNGACIPDLACGAGTRLDPDTEDCVPGEDVCAPGSILVDDRCQPVVEEPIVPDAVEAAEPNELDGAAGTIPVRAVGADPFIAYGCVEPRDLDASGDYEYDQDSWRVSVVGPVVLELESLGVGGLAPGFIMVGRDDALVMDFWQRRAMDLVDGHSRWRFLLPAAGDYDLFITDARSMLAGLPAGGPEACYYAKVRQLPLPDPVAVPSPVDVFELESGVRLYAIDVAAGSLAEVIGETPRLSTLLGLTLLVDGDYVRSVTEQLVPTNLPAQLGIDDSLAGDVVVAADASIDFGYAPVEARVLERQVASAAAPATAGGAR